MTIKCPKCKTQMLLRNGQYGEFFFCPNNKVCGAKVISKKQAIAKGMIKGVAKKVVNKTITTTTPDVNPNKVKALLSNLNKGYTCVSKPTKAPPMSSVLDKRVFPYNVPMHLKKDVVEHLEWLISCYLDKAEELK